MGKKKGKIAYIEGIYSSGPRGGFVDVDENYSVYIPSSDRNGSFEKDKVKVEITLKRAGKKDEGKVVEILERGITKVVGVLDKSKDFGFVIPDGKVLKEDIFIPKKDINGAKDGQMVICKITEYPASRNSHAEGEIIEIIGYKDEPGVDIRAIVESMNIPDKFPEEVMAEAERIPDSVSPKDAAKRMDLRDKITVTIDSDSAKDLDDAISIEKNGDMYRLYVSIADVSEYVTLGSKLNEEAIKRGTSAYLCNRVIPMLPKKLSNGICSLNEQVDRLTLSCIMDIDNKGNVISHQIAETVINVNHRMSYVSVQKILDGDKEEIDKYNDIAHIFPLMHELSLIIRKRRQDRGGIDFNIDESEIILNDEGFPVIIRAHERNEASRIIEDFMIMANETVAKALYDEHMPCVYRIHEEPGADKIDELKNTLHTMGITIKTNHGKVHPMEIQKLLKSVEGKSEEAFVSFMTLRCMNQARYSSYQNRHFGLASDYYCHFTSPIRRYPDLLVHRIIKDYLNNRMDDDKINYYNMTLEGLAASSSNCERRAVQAEREVNRLKKAQYMIERIGEEYEGVVSGVTDFGMFVMLPNTIEGMIRLGQRGKEKLFYDDKTKEVRSNRRNLKYRLGDSIKIRVINVDVSSRTIDFDLGE